MLPEKLAAVFPPASVTRIPFPHQRLTVDSLVNPVHSALAGDQRGQISPIIPTAGVIITGSGKSAGGRQCCDSSSWKCSPSGNIGNGGRNGMPSRIRERIMKKGMDFNAVP